MTPTHASGVDLRSGLGASNQVLHIAASGAQVRTTGTAVDLRGFAQGLKRQCATGVRASGPVAMEEFMKEPSEQPLSKTIDMSQAIQQGTVPSVSRRKTVSQPQAVTALLGSCVIAALMFGAVTLSGAGDARAVTQVPPTPDTPMIAIQAGRFVLLP